MARTIGPSVVTSVGASGRADGGGEPARHGRLVAREPGVDRGEQLGHRLQSGEPQPSGALGRGAQERQGGDRPVDEQHGVGPHQVGLHDDDEHARLQRQLRARRRATARAGSPRVCSWLPSPNSACTRHGTQPVLGGDLRDAAHAPRPTSSGRRRTCCGPARRAPRRAARGRGPRRRRCGLAARPARRRPRRRRRRRRARGSGGRRGVRRCSTWRRASAHRPATIAAPREPQAQLGALGAAQAVQGALADLQCLGGPAEQGQHVHPVGGRGVLARLVQERRGAAHGAAADVRAGQLDEDRRPSGRIAGFDVEPGGDSTVPAGVEHAGGPGGEAPRVPGAAGWRARRRG